MADLGNLYFDILLRDMTDADIDKIKKKLAKVGVKIGVDADKATLAKNIKEALKNRTFKIDVEPNKNIKKAAIEVNKSVLTKSVSDALKGKTFSADLKLVVKTAEVQDAIRQAFSKAGMNYNTTASDVRAARIAEIQQRMAMRAAQAQRRVGDAHRYAASGAYESARASVTLGRSFHSNIRLAGELGTAMGNFASVFGIKDLLEGVVKIGGQLENQRIALGAILQDGGKATEMFAKIQSLAVKSPFGIMDLNQYTKQLSAYGIEYNELYDTMKRLADISAGVGVDMGRIILAYGQVRAAGFLKGTELRQFTEANIPLVQKLADRFSVLEKRIVSAADVYDMISKKKITFEDVKSVLWDLTDEGGMFSGMQEVLSESLASKWKNLADALDVMYGKIADGAIGNGLKELAELLTDITENWKDVASATTSAASAYAIYKAAVILGGKQIASANSLISGTIANKQKEANNLRLASTYRELTRAEKKLIDNSGNLTRLDARRLIQNGVLNKELALQLIATNKLDDSTKQYLIGLYRLNAKMVETAQNSSWMSRAMVVAGNAIRSVGIAIKTAFANPFTWLFVGFEVIGKYITNFMERGRRFEELTNSVNDSARNSINILKNELKKIESLEIGKLNTDQMKIKIREITTLIQNEAPNWRDLLADVFQQDADGNFVKTAKVQLDMLIDKIGDVKKAKEMMLSGDSTFAEGVENTDTAWNPWNDDVIENLKQYGDAVTENDKKLATLGRSYNNLKEAIDLATNKNPELQSALAEKKTIQEQILLLKEYTYEYNRFRNVIEKKDGRAGSILRDYFSELAEINSITGERGRFLSDLTPLTDRIWDELLSKGYTKDSMLDDSARQLIFYYGQKLIEQAKIQSPKVQEMVWKNYLQPFNMEKKDEELDLSKITTPQTNETYDASKDEVAKMWKNRAEEIEKAVSLYDQWKEVEGKDKASSRVASKKELANLFNGQYGFNLNLENPEEAYRFILDKLDLSKSAQKELAIKLGVDLDEATLDDAKAQLKDFLEKSKKIIDDTTKRWDLYKELFKATGNKTVSANIAFGGSISFKDQLEQLKAEIEKELGDTGISFDKLIGMSTEELEGNGLARFKNLVEAYNKESMKMKEESVKNFIAIVNASKDFAQQISDIERKLEKDLSDLRSNAKGMPESELKRRENELIKKAEEDKNSVRFEEFKKSSDWVKVFDDLDRVSNATLDSMIKNVEEFAKRTNLGVKETKELVEALGKLRDEAIERNPFKGFRDALNRKQYLKSGVLTESGMVRFGSGTKDDPYTFKNKKDVDNGIAEANEDLKDASLAVADKFQAVANAADLLSGLFENLGVDLGGVSDLFGGMAGGAQSGAGIASAFGLDGPWGAIAGAAVGMLSSVFAMHDKALQKEIEASEARTELIENISKNLEETLERNLGGIYTTGIDKATRENLKSYIKDYELWKNVPNPFNKGVTSKESYDKAYEALNQDSYYDAQLASLMLERDELKHRKELEADKKKADKAKLADYEQELVELESSIKNFALDMANTLYGIDFKDWAGQLAESLVSAWASGEDAVEAYKDTVNNILRNLGVSVISQKIIEPLLQSTMDDFLAQFEKDNGKLTESSMSILAGMANGAEEAAKVTEAYFEGLKKLGIDLSESSDEAKDSLSKGVQGETEETANLRNSYLNAIRQDVSVKRSLIEKLVGEDIPEMGYIAQAQLRELNQIAANTKRNADAADKIYDLVNRVVDKGSNKLKV